MPKVDRLVACIEAMLAARLLVVTDLPGSAREDSRSLRHFIAEAAELNASVGMLSAAVTQMRRERAGDWRLARRFDATATIFAAADRDKGHRALRTELGRLSRRSDRDALYHLELIRLVVGHMAVLDRTAATLGTLPLSGSRKAEVFFRHTDARTLRHVGDRLLLAGDFDMLHALAEAARGTVLLDCVEGLRHVSRTARLHERFLEFSAICTGTSCWTSRRDLIAEVPWLEPLPLLAWLSVLERAGAVRLRQSGPGAAWFVRSASFDDDLTVPTTREGRIARQRSSRLLAEFVRGWDPARLSPAP